MLIHRHSSRVFLAVGALLASAIWAPAQQTTPAKPISPDSDKSEQPQKKRAISSELANSLAATMPKYDPPKRVEKKAEDDVDLREVDKPKNGIIRLPKVVVEGYRPPIFTERDLARSLSALAMKRYRGLGVGPLAGLNAPIAVQMYREDERLQNISDLNGTAEDAARGGDRAGSEYIRRQTNETFIRRGDWGWSGNQK
jgi:hypothetical protein